MTPWENHTKLDSEPLESRGQEALRPVHIVAGLGGGEREFLATCLALFEEASLGASLTRLYDTAKGKIGELSSRELVETADEVRHRQNHWQDSNLSDAHLGLMLWMQLRNALQLEPKLSATFRGAEKLADDISAAAISLLSPPPGIFESGKKRLRDWGVLDASENPESDSTNLHAVVEPVLKELLEAALINNADDGTVQEVIEEAVTAMDRLSAEDRARIREELGIDELTASALAKVALTGGGLTLFSILVSMGGFSAYILAAKASAFIPLVSGPGLVSFVAVVSNPITAAAGTIGAGWWLRSSANQKIRAAVAVRIIAMLAIQGLNAGRAGIRSALVAFTSLADLPEKSGVSSDLVSDYRDELPLIGSNDSLIYEWGGQSWRIFEQPLTVRAGSRSGRQERDNTITLATLTVGDMLYNTAQISPDAMAAADFSYLADVDGPVDFALLAASMGEGASVRLKGYVAEQVVAAKLQAAGHVVSLPESASEPGWDLLVDGQRFQVKFHSDVAGIREHFAQYDYPVIANTELVGEIPDEFVGRVQFIDGVSNELVTDITEMSVSAGQGMTDADVAAFAFAISAFRSARGLYNGELTRTQAAEQVLMDGTIRVGLAAAGSWAGTGAGLLLFGPAGAWVFGAGLPILAQSQTSKIGNQLKEQASLPERKRWMARAHDMLDALQKAGLDSLDSRLQQLAHARSGLPTGFARDYIVHRAHDQRLFAMECINRQVCVGRQSIPQPEQRLSQTLRWLAASDVHPMVYQDELADLEGCMQERPGLADEWRSNEVQAKVSQAKAYGHGVLQEGLDVREKLGRWWRGDAPKNEP